MIKFTKRVVLSGANVSQQIAVEPGAVGVILDKGESCTIALIKPESLKGIIVRGPTAEIEKVTEEILDPASDVELTNYRDGQLMVTVIETLTRKNLMTLADSLRSLNKEIGNG